MEKIKAAIEAVLILCALVFIVAGSGYLVIREANHESVQYKFDTGHIISLKGDGLELCWTENRVLYNGKVIEERRCGMMRQ